MKKLFLLTALIAGSFASQAQSSFGLGVKGGVNIATVAGDFESPDSRTSFNAGLVLELPISDRFSIQPELVYSGQGFTVASRDQENFLDTDDNVEFQLDYIQLPVLAKVYLVDGLNLQVGPTFSVLINDELDYQPLSDEGDIDVYSEGNDFEIGAAAGLEYIFDGGFFIQARYIYGFSDIYDNVDIHNSVFQAGIGLRFF